MQSHPLFTKACVLTACICQLQLHAQHRVLAKAADQQSTLKWIAAAGVVSYTIHAYYATCKQDQKITEQLQLFEKLNSSYQKLPEAFTISQLEQRCMDHNGKQHSLSAEQDAIIADQKTLQAIDALLLEKSSSKMLSAREKIQLLLKKLRSIEHSIALAIAPFDLAVCITTYEEQFKTLIEAQQHGLHEALCFAYQKDLYPYLACAEEIKQALDTIKGLQSKVDPHYDVFGSSEHLCKVLHNLFVGITSESHYHEQTRQKLQDMKDAEALVLQRKQLQTSQKQTRHLDEIKTNIQQLLAKHDEQLRINLQHLNAFNLQTAQLNAHNTTQQQKELAFLRLITNATQSAQETQELIRLQQQELQTAQALQKQIADKARQGRHSPQQLNQTSIAEEPELDSPGALQFPTSPSAPREPSNYPQVSSNPQPEGRSNN